MQNRPLDPSQRAAEPTAPITLSQLRGATKVEGDGGSKDAIANRTNAARELSMIEELRANSSFQWFEREFIDKAYRAAFDDLRDEFTPIEDTARVRATYAVLRKLKTALIDREIVHLQLTASDDAEIKRLTQKRDLL